MDFVKGAAGGGVFGLAKSLDLTGSRARGDLESGYRDSQGQLQSGYDEAKAIGERYYRDAQGYLQPYVQGGRDADAMQRNALGLNGREAQSKYYSDFQTDPGFQGEVNAGVRALDHSAAARGGLYSGQALKAVSAYGQQKMGDAYRGRYNQLAQYGQQGLQAAGNAAGIAQQFGSDQSNMRYGFGQQSATNRINIGNALAQNRGTLMNNLIGIGGVVAKAAPAFSDRRLKRDIERVGALPSGLSTYTYRYLWSDDLQLGVMADEASRLFPLAVSASPDGFLMVDYSQIG